MSRNGLTEASVTTELVTTLKPDGPAVIGVDPAADRWLACLPLAHIGGLSVVTRALLTGTPLEVHDGFDPAAVDAAADRGATHVSLVPTALRRIHPARWRRISPVGRWSMTAIRAPTLPYPRWRRRRRG